MVHVYGSVGQLGNQLFRFAHHLANAIALNYKLVHHSFDYGQYYSSLGNTGIISVNNSGTNTNKIIIKLSNKLFRSPSSHEMAQKLGYYILNEPLTYEDTDATKFGEFAINKQVIATEWLFRDYNNFIIYAQQLREAFIPNNDIVEHASQKISKISADFEIVIGVHIRRGDYITFENGAFYFLDSEYARVMKQMKELHPGKKIAFVICSNEKIDMNTFSEFNCFSWSNHFMIDLTLLSYCDFIIGPPSTFSGWASFIGNIPLYHHSKKGALPGMGDFKVTMR